MNILLFSVDIDFYLRSFTPVCNYDKNKQEKKPTPTLQIEKKKKKSQEGEGKQVGKETFY